MGEVTDGGNGQSEARRLQSRLNHPIIDADGHWLEYTAVLREEYRLWGEVNPDFFKGTVAEEPAAEVLAQLSTSA